MNKSNRTFCEYEYFWVIAQMREYMKPESIRFMLDTMYMRQHIDRIDMDYFNRMKADLLG